MSSNPSVIVNQEFNIDDIIYDDDWDDRICRCHCYIFIILILTISASLIFIEIYGVEKLCYKFVHPDMQAVGDFRDHDRHSYKMPIC